MKFIETTYNGFVNAAEIRSLFIEKRDKDLFYVCMITKTSNYDISDGYSNEDEARDYLFHVINQLS